MKKIVKKCYGVILAIIMLLSAIPFTGIAAMAAEPADQMMLSNTSLQIYLNGGTEIYDGNGFIMADGSIAICAERNKPSPANGTLLTIDRTLGDSYVDGDVGVVSTEWAFLCFYYSHQLAQNGAIATTEQWRSFATNAAIRRAFDGKTASVGDPNAVSVVNYTQQIIAAAEADADGLRGTIRLENGVAIGVHNGIASRMAYYSTGNAATQKILVFTTNIPYSGSVQLMKTSANPAITDGNSCYSLAGAEYHVWSDPNGINYVGSLITDEWGNTNLLELTAGTYYVREMVAPLGFALDSTVHTVTVTAGQTATINVQDIPLADPIGILINKVDAETNFNVPQGTAKLEGTEFTVKYFAGFYDINPEELGVWATRTWVLRTDADGFLYLADTYKVFGDELYYHLDGNPTIPLGTITIQETKAPEGYLINSEIFVRQIQSGSATEMVSTYNAPIVPETVIKGYAELYKTDVESGSKLAGAVYGLYFHDGTEVARLTTNANGYAKSDLLPYGSYYFKEITAPVGFVLDTKQYPFNITADDAVVTVNAADQLQMAQITGTKTGEMLTGSTSTITEDGTLYTPTYRTQGIPNATYDIFAKTDIITSAGIIKYKAGQLVDTVTTNAQGKFTSKQLYLGSYMVKEKQAPQGFVLDTTEYEVTLSYGGQTQNIVLSPIALSDERQKVSVSVKKEMEENTVYPNPEAYKDVRFGLYVAEDILDVTGTVALEKDSLLEVITLDKADTTETNTASTGSEILTGTVSMDLPIGSYYLQELATNKAYVLDNTKYPIDFTYQGQEIATVEITANEGKPIVNSLKKGQVELIKESDFPQSALEQGFTNLPLEGAVYGIYSTDGTEVGRMTTDVRGYAKSDLLPYGSYYLREITAPFGYEVNENEYHFIISTDGEVICITALDKPKIGTITPEYNDNGGGENLRTTPTGDNSMNLYFIGGGLLISSGVVFSILIFRKKESSQ